MLVENVNFFGYGSWVIAVANIKTEGTYLIGGLETTDTVMD